MGAKVYCLECHGAEEAPPVGMRVDTGIEWVEGSHSFRTVVAVVGSEGQHLCRGCGKGHFDAWVRSNVGRVYAPPNDEGGESPAGLSGSGTNAPTLGQVHAADFGGEKAGAGVEGDQGNAPGLAAVMAGPEKRGPGRPPKAK